jgi:hypothetical protein
MLADCSRSLRGAERLYSYDKAGPEGGPSGAVGHD